MTGFRLLLVVVSWSSIGLLMPAQEDKEMSNVLVNLHRPGPTADKSKLSPALQTLSISGGQLVGSDYHGNPVFRISTAKTPLLQKHPLVNSIGPSPADLMPVKRLRISYKSSPRPEPAELEKLGLREIEDYKLGSFLIVEPIDGRIDASLVTKMETHPRIQFVTPVLKAKALPKPSMVKRNVQVAKNPPTNDPQYGSLWGMENIKAPVAWKTIQKSAVIVAVIDTGVNYNHNDLATNIWKNAAGKHGHDFVDNDNDPMDGNGHGTHCAGTIGAIGNNGVGVVGVNWEVQIMALRWLDNGGFGEVENAIKCIDFAANNGAKVLSNSWYWFNEDADLRDAIERAREKGALFVAAASNFGQDNDKVSSSGRIPSSYGLDNIISVLAIDSTETKAGFSNYGKKTVHLGAPGVAIKSTVLNNGYDDFDGTSMATPHVAGAAALTWSHKKFAGTNYAAVRQAILDNCRVINGLNGRCITGGTLDISFLK